MARMRAHTLSTGVVAAGAAAVPLACVAALSLGPFANSVLPPVITAPVQSDMAVGVVGELCRTMLTMSVGAAVASGWIYRQAMRPRQARLGTGVFALAMVLALVSIYSGLRFQFDLALQLRFEPLDFERLESRLFWQGGALLLQSSCLCAGATLHYLHRDRRHGERE